MKWYLTPVSHYVQKAILFFSFLVMGIVTLAQDKQVDINVNTKKDSNFWGQPWVWVVGAAVFILLLVAILRSGGRKSA
jgi:heme A synthase